ncbi:arginine--tRNA ligase [bacterium]|nr:arginine--tRNA ligase [bacterium]
MINEKKQIIADLIKIDGVTSQEIYDAIEIPADKKMGDFSLPCFRFSKVLRKAPMVIAQDIAKSITTLPYPVTSVSALNGYVNFLTDKLYTTKKVLKEIEQKGSNYGDSKEGSSKTVCIDYSSINIAKPFHIGHLSTTVIGGCLYRVYKKLGYNCVGINHLGDWGTQFGKLIVAFKLWCSEEELDREGMKVLTNIYVKFHEESEKDPSLEDQARMWFKKIEDGDSEALRLFNLFKEITLKEVEKTYKRLKISFDSYAGESFYNDKMEPVLKELEKDGLLELSEGAKVVSLEKYDMPPCLLVKNDGATLYATRDLAAAFYRKNTYDFYKCLYVVAYQQNLHFRQWFKVVELMGKDWAKDLYHVAFGMVSLEDGAMSTRRGKVVLLEDVLDKAVEKSLAIITEKNPDLDNKEDVAEKVGVGAVIFSTMYNNRIKDIVFSYDKVLNFDGETGPYVQYTNARTISLLNKAGSYDINNADFSGLDNEESHAVISLLEKFPSVIIDAAEKYEPCYIGRFLVDLCKEFNRFYLANRIIGENDAIKAARLSLVNAVHKVIEEGLSLMGISAPEKM